MFHELISRCPRVLDGCCSCGLSLCVYVCVRVRVFPTGMREYSPITSCRVRFCLWKRLCEPMRSPPVQLGIGSYVNVLLPPASDTLSGMVAVSAALQTTCSLSSAGLLFCWGANVYAQVRPLLMHGIENLLLMAKHARIFLCAFMSWWRCFQHSVPSCCLKSVSPSFVSLPLSARVRVYMTLFFSAAGPRICLY
jgi:hypothetical protein